MTTILITGANRGIGLELTKVMVANEHEVLACCRSSSDALDNSGAEIICNLDVADNASIAALVAQLGNPPPPAMISS